jgi:hypothetical protein
MKYSWSKLFTKACYMSLRHKKSIMSMKIKGGGKQFASGYDCLVAILCQAIRNNLQYRKSKIEDCAWSTNSWNSFESKYTYISVHFWNWISLFKNLYKYSFKTWEWICFTALFGLTPFFYLNGKQKKRKKYKINMLLFLPLRVSPRC